MGSVKYNTLESIPDDLLSHAKIYGFSDFQIARHVLKSDPAEINDDLMKVRQISGKRSA